MSLNSGFARPLSILFFGIILFVSCSKVTGYEEELDVAVLGYIEYFNVPDSSTQQSIQVTLKGTIGESSAFHFDRINFARTDSVFRIAVWGRQIYRTSEQYDPIHVGFDTVLVLNTPRFGLHYFEVVAAQGILRDSTLVY